MLLKKKLITLIAISTLAAPATIFAATTGNATPTQYLVTVSNIQFHRVGDPSTTYITYASGTSTFDIAGTSPGGFVGKVQKTGNLLPGTYDKIRFTVSKSMKIKGASNGVLVGNGKTCRTISADSSVSNPFGDGSVNTAYLGATNSGSAELSNVAVPTGTSVTLPTGFTDQGSTMLGTISVNFTIPEAPAGTPILPPDITINFDVTNAIDFEAINATQCVVFPGPPSINVAVG
jgi:hypothetical protein